MGLRHKTDTGYIRVSVEMTNENRNSKQTECTNATLFYGTDIPRYTYSEAVLETSKLAYVAAALYKHETTACHAGTIFDRNKPLYTCTNAIRYAQSVQEHKS